MGQEAFVELLCSGAKWRAICVRNQVVNGEVMASWLQPIQHGLRVYPPLRWLDSAKERVLEDPLKLPCWGIPQKVGLMEFRLQTGYGGSLPGQTDSAWGKVKATSLKAAAGPSADIVPSAATGDANGPARKLRMRLQEIDQAWRRGAFFPGHILGLVPFLPIGFAHGMKRDSAVIKSVGQPFPHRVVQSSAGHAPLIGYREWPSPTLSAVPRES